MLPALNLLIGCTAGPGGALLSGAVEDSDDDPPQVAAIDVTESDEVNCASPVEQDGDRYVRTGSADWDAQATGSDDAPTGWGLVIADLNADDIPDAFLPQYDQDELFLGAGDGTFERAAFPAEHDVGSGASAADYDGDGDLDLYVANHGPNRLWRNDSGTFVDVTAYAGVADGPWDSNSTSWADIDGDGDLDLAVGKWYERTSHLDDPPDSALGDRNGLYLNNGNGTFTDASDRLTGDASLGFTYSMGWFDVDGDSDQDLYVVNDKDQAGYRDALLLNDGDGNLTFDDGNSATNVAVQGMGLGVGDLNDDLIPDFFVPGWNELVLLVSGPDGRWHDAASATGVIPDPRNDRVVGWGGDLVDLDNDGDLDLPIAYGTDAVDLTAHPEKADLLDQVAPAVEPDAVFRQKADGTFEQAADPLDLAERGVGRGFVVADVNRDGVLDLIKRNLLSQATVDLSNCAAEAWAEIRLHQSGMNPDAIGARVSVVAAGVRHTRWTSAGSTNLASSGPPDLHFGLGAATGIERIEIVWPDGATSEANGVAVNRIIRILRRD